ncbi:MAG: PDZ domain-containing protein, partial [Myxococcales bacterium]|nr:PDZ domain-containing protein [Myxococcales bacterium]
IGNPFGVGQTVTMGIVSATGRSHAGVADDEALIQTDAAINPGNSGGALVDLRGRLVGVNTAILSRSGGSQGVGFAIPSNLAAPIMERLIERGSDSPGWIGAIFLDAAPAANRRAAGVEAPFVSDLTAGGPAEWAGLKRGDAVVAVDGTPVRTGNGLRDIVAARGAGAWISLRVLRGGEELEIPVPLDPPPRIPGERYVLGPREGALGGLTLVALIQSVRDRYGIPERVPGGIVIASVNPEGYVARSGLREGDAILELNGVAVESVAAFIRLYKAAVGDQLHLTYYRDGVTMNLVSRRR